MAQWKISRGYDYALLPNRECNQKQKHKKQPWEKAESPNDFSWQGRDISRPRQMIDSQYSIKIMGGREVSRPYRVWFFAEGERFFYVFCFGAPRIYPQNRENGEMRRLSQKKSVESR